MSDAIWQLLYPKHGGELGVLDLTEMIITEQGRGMSPLHYNVQRGTYQHGETPISMRLDPRVIQIALADERQSRSILYEELARLLHRLNPGRNWATNGALTKCTYRKIMPGGRRQWRSDLVTTSGSTVVTSAAGRFVEWGLGPGEPFDVVDGADIGSYVIASVTNENTLELTQAMIATSTGVQYRVVTGRIMRDLYVLLEAGPVLTDDKTQDDLTLGDTVKLIAHDPVWINPVRQSATWSLINLANLIFYEPITYPDRAVFPIWFGANDVMVTASLTYLGTWPTRPTVIITGPFTKFTLENVTTGNKLVLSYTAAIGEVVTIDLSTLTVTNNFGQSLMRYMSTPYTDMDSDLITFGFYPDPQVAGGINTINMIISQALINTTFASLYWYSRYIGV